MLKKSLCILHVGLHHTATSAFQKCLTINRQNLKKMSILYPLTGISGNQHSLIPGCFFSEHNALPDNRNNNIDYYIKKLEKEINKSKCQVCIISSEVFTELINKDHVIVRIVIDKLLTIFHEIKIFISTRDSEQRALSQLKAMLRKSVKNSKFRKEIFQANTFFNNKINQTKLLIKKWEKIDNKLLIYNINNKSNAVEGYFEFLFKVLKNDIRTSTNEYKTILDYKFYDNKDNLPRAIYLLCILVGNEIFKKDTFLEEKFDFSFVEQFYENIDYKDKYILNQISDFHLLQYFKFKDKLIHEKSLISLDTEIFAEFYKMNYSQAYITIKTAKEIIYSLIKILNLENI